MGETLYLRLHSRPLLDCIVSIVSTFLAQTVGLQFWWVNSVCVPLQKCGETTHLKRHRGEKSNKCTFEKRHSRKSYQSNCLCAFAKMWRNNTQGKSQPAVTKAKTATIVLQIQNCIANTNTNTDTDINKYMYTDTNTNWSKLVAMLTYNHCIFFDEIGLLLREELPVHKLSKSWHCQKHTFQTNVMGSKLLQVGKVTVSFWFWSSYKTN